MKFGILTASIILSLASSLSAQTRPFTVIYDQYYVATGGNPTSASVDLSRGLHIGIYNLRQRTGKTYSWNYPTATWNSNGFSSWDAIFAWMDSKIPGSGMKCGFTNWGPANGVQAGNKVVICDYPTPVLKSNWENSMVVQHEFSHIYGAPDHYIYNPADPSFGCIMNKYNPLVLTGPIGWCASCRSTISRNADYWLW